MTVPAAPVLSPTTIPPTPTALLRLFIGVALAGIGGGLPAHTRRAMLARRWITEQDFAESFTLAQLTPGPNGVNLAAMLGARLCGPRGALLSVLGILTPGLIVMLAASMALLSSPGGLSPTLQSALRGAACAGLAILATAAIPVVRVGVGVRGGAVLALLTFAGLGLLRIDLLPVFIVMIGAGLSLNRPRRVPPPEDGHA